MTPFILELIQYWKPFQLPKKWTWTTHSSVICSSFSVQSGSGSIDLFIMMVVVTRDTYKNITLYLEWIFQHILEFRHTKKWKFSISFCLILTFPKCVALLQLVNFILLVWGCHSNRISWCFITSEKICNTFYIKLT